MTESSMPLASQIRDDLQARLVAGRYRPGQRLSIEDLKGELGVSKQPIMEALRRLEETGLVQIAPQSGCRVRVYAPAEITDFFGLFARFEGEIAAAAAHRRTHEQVVDLDEASAAVAALDAVAAPEDRAAGYLRANRHFHRVVHEMAASPLMAGLSTRMWDLSDFLITTVRGPDSLAGVVHHRNEEHDLIRSAIALGEPETARAAMESHIRGSVTAT